MQVATRLQSVCTATCQQVALPKRRMPRRSLSRGVCVEATARGERAFNRDARCAFFPPPMSVPREEARAKRPQTRQHGMRSLPGSHCACQSRSDALAPFL